MVHSRHQKRPSTGNIGDRKPEFPPGETERFECGKQRNHLRGLNRGRLEEELESTKRLGMYQERGLTWDSHMDHVCKNIESGI